MKLTKQRLKEIIREELGSPREQDPSDPAPRRPSPREAGREWAIKNLAVAVDSALGSGLSNDEIHEVIVRAFDRQSLRGDASTLRESK